MKAVEITELIDRYLRGEATPEEKMQVERLLSAPNLSLDDREKFRQEMELQKDIILAIQERGLREMLRRTESDFVKKRKIKRTIIWSLLTLCVLALTTLGIIVAKQEQAWREQEQIAIHEQLQNLRTHYIIAVDVSVSMCRYESVVLPGLTKIVTDIPYGDRVTIIPFGLDAMDNRLGLDIVADTLSKKQLLDLLGTIYPHGYECRAPQFNSTNICKAQLAIEQSCLINSDYYMNIIVYISDMIHCPDFNITRSFDQNEINTMMTSMPLSSAGTMAFVLEFPLYGDSTGYVYPQLQELYHSRGATIELYHVEDHDNDIILRWAEELPDMVTQFKLEHIGVY